jgi:hypothetical protein
MIIAAHLGVKDEATLIERAIGHLYSIGIDTVLVCDMSSTDGTKGILDRHSSEKLRTIQIPNRVSSAEWLGRNLELIQSVKADWIIFLDADEFWICSTGDLRSYAKTLTGIDIVTVNRFNIPLGPDGPWAPPDLRFAKHDELLLVVDQNVQSRGSNLRKRLQEDPTLPWILGVPVPKVMARPDRIAGLIDGMHDIIPTSDGPLRRLEARDLLIAHLPLTTRDRFFCKVRNMKEVFEANDFGEDIAWHWRRWYNLLLEGALDHEFDRSILDDEAVRRLRRSGIIQSAAELFRSWPLGEKPHQR